MVMESVRQRVNNELNLTLAFILGLWLVNIITWPWVWLPIGQLATKNTFLQTVTTHTENLLNKSPDFMLIISTILLFHISARKVRWSQNKNSFFPDLDIIKIMFLTSSSVVILWKTVFCICLCLVWIKFLCRFFSFPNKERTHKFLHLLYYFNKGLPCQGLFCLE